MSNTKIHPWPTRKNPDTGRYEVQIQGIWRSRQYAWQLLRRMEGLCKSCGRKALKKDYPFCRRCAKKKAIDKHGKWNGPKKLGSRGRPSESANSYTKYLPNVKSNSDAKKKNLGIDERALERAESAS